MPDNIPEKIAFEYDFVKKIGEGANGETWLAKSRINRKLAAIKCLKLNAANDLKSFELFKREVALLKSIQIEGVPKFYDAYIPDALEQSFLIQEYIDAPSIQDIMDLDTQKSPDADPADAGETHARDDRETPSSNEATTPSASQKRSKQFSEKETLLIAKKIATILVQLQTSYSPPIIHRDIKPSNILYNVQTQEVYLIDFGSVANPQKRTGGSTIAGTFGYMPPEQIFGDVAPQSDFYALGATMLHMLTGIMPYNLSSNVYQLDIDQALDTYAPDTSSGVKQLLKSLLSADIHSRPTSALVLLNELEYAQSCILAQPQKHFLGRCFYKLKQILRKIKNRFYPQASNTLSFNIDPEQFASSEVNAAPKIEPTSHAYTPKKTTECLKEKIITLKATQKNFCSKQVKNDLVTKNWVKCKGELRRIICFSHFTPSESIFRDSNSIIFRDSNSIDLVEYTFTANTHTYKSYYPLPSSYINPKFPIPCTILYNPKDPLENGIYDIYGDEL